jgi:hypothetical protein
MPGFLLFERTVLARRTTRLVTPVTPDRILNGTDNHHSWGDMQVPRTETEE